MNKWCLPLSGIAYNHKKMFLKNSEDLENAHSIMLSDKNTN